MSLLRFEGVSVDYPGHRALDALSLAVGPGEIVALVGRSGSGKSTALAAALGLLPAGAILSGSITLDGRALADLSGPALDALRGGFAGLVFQEPLAALDPLMSIGRQVAEAVRAHRAIGRAEAMAIAAGTLVRVGLDPGEVSPARFPHQLSGGQRQRAQVAAAIAARPVLLLADEPTASLDGVARAELLALFRRLAREDGMGLLLVTHDLAAAASVADRVAVLAGGTLVEEGPARDLLAAPAHPATRALLAGPLARGAAVPRGAETVLEARGLCCRRPGAAPGSPPAVADVSLALARGETVAIVGGSGAGKSTLARLLLGLERPDAGSVRIGGADLARARGAGLRAIRRQVQAVFQDPHASLDPRMTVGASIAEPLRLLPRRLAPADRAARVARALADVGLPADAAHRRPHAFSGGERQRIAIARALIGEPALVILDEPTSALDPGVRGEILRLLARLQREHGTAYLLVTHDLALVSGFADRVLVMEEGRIVEEGETATLLERPRHPATRALVEAARLAG